MNCPKCGESNSSDMAFCIFCGTALRGSQAINIKQSAVATAPRTCANCGQTDSLNRVFCIFCGSRVDPAASGIQPAVADRPPAIDPRITEQRAVRSRTLGLVASVVAGMLGAALGLWMSWFYNGLAEPPKSGRDLPPKGLVLLTAAPFSSFQVISDGRRFLSGKTGKDGDIVLNNVDPKDYDVRIEAPDGRHWEQRVEVKGKGPSIIGAETEIFAK